MSEIYKKKVTETNTHKVPMIKRRTVGKDQHPGNKVYLAKQVGVTSIEDETPMKKASVKPSPVYIKKEKEIVCDYVPEHLKKKTSVPKEKEVACDYVPAHLKKKTSVPKEKEVACDYVPTHLKKKPSVPKEKEGTTNPPKETKKPSVPKEKEVTTPPPKGTKKDSKTKDVPEENSTETSMKSILLKHHKFVSLPNKKAKLSKTWEKDLEFAIINTASESTLLGIFMNVYPHAEKNHDLLVDIYAIMMKSFFLDSIAPNPNLFFEFLDIICNKENDVYTYIYYLLAFANTKKSNALSICDFVFNTKEGREAALQQNIELTTFEEGTKASTIMKFCKDVLPENPFDSISALYYMRLYHNDEAHMNEFLEYIYNHIVEPFDPDGLLKNALQFPSMYSGRMFQLFLLFVAIYGIYIGRDSEALYRKIKVELMKNDDLFHLPYPTKEEVNENNIVSSRRFDDPTLIKLAQEVLVLKSPKIDS